MYAGTICYRVPQRLSDPKGRNFGHGGLGFRQSNSSKAFPNTCFFVSLLGFDFDPMVDCQPLVERCKRRQWFDTQQNS